MSYTKTNWIAREGVKLNRFTKLNEDASSVELLNNPESVTVAGTPINETNLNHIEDGIEDIHDKVDAGEVSDESLMLRMTYDDLPEIPDDPAGVTYLNNNFTDADGWTAANGTVYASGGELVFNKTNAAAYNVYADKTISVSAKQYIVKITAMQNINNFILYRMSGTTYESIETGSMLVGEQEKIAIYGADSYTSIRLLANTLTSAQTGDLAKVEYIYIGTGEYLPRKDATGNHLIKVVGSVPVPGISGNGIRRDGVCAYEQTVDAVPMPDKFTFSQWIDGEEKSVIQSFFYTTNATQEEGRFYISRRGNSNTLAIGYSDGATIFILDISDYFTSGNFLMGVNVEWDSSGTGLDVTVYKDGVLFGTYSAPTAVKPDTNVWYFGKHKTAGWFATGTFDELRIWSRALSAKEHYNLFRSKSRGPVTHIYANALNRSPELDSTAPGYEGAVNLSSNYLQAYSSGAWRKAYLSPADAGVNPPGYTYVVDSDAALDAWCDNTEGNDYTSVLIKSGTWTATTGKYVDFNTTGTKVVFGEAGNLLVFDGTYGLYHSGTPDDDDYVFGVNVDKVGNIGSSFNGIDNLSNCTAGTYITICHKISNCTAVGQLSYCNNISNCTAGTYINSCRNISNCTVETYISNSDNISNCTANYFETCRNISNCTANYFDTCTGLVNCKSSVSGTAAVNGFVDCENIDGCIADVSTTFGNAIAFNNCENLTSCQGDAETASGTGYGFKGCTGITSCKGSGIGTTAGYGFFACLAVSRSRKSATSTTSTFYGGTLVDRCYPGFTVYDTFLVGDTADGGFNDIT